MTTFSLQLLSGEGTSRKIELLFETKTEISSWGRLKAGEAKTALNRVILMTKDLSVCPVVILDGVASWSMVSR